MKHLGKHLIPYLFENSDLVHDLIGYETIEEIEMEDLNVDMLDFLKKSKDARYIDFPDREFVGIQSSILEGNLTYSYMFGYIIKDGYSKWNPDDEEDEIEYKDAKGNIMINIIFNDFKLNTIQGLVFFPNGEEENIQFYPTFRKPSFKGRAGEL